MEEEVVREPDPLDEVDEVLRQDIDQLISQGCLSEAITFGGHSFIIKTLNAAENNSAAIAVKPYQGTVRELSAIMQATIGLAVVSYDGKTDFLRKLDDAITHAIKRFDFVSKWDDATIEYIFGRYTTLNQRAVNARMAITNLSEQDRPDSSPFADSSTEWGTSQDEMPPGLAY